MAGGSNKKLVETYKKEKDARARQAACRCPVRIQHRSISGVAAELLSVPDHIRPGHMVRAEGHQASTTAASGQPPKAKTGDIERIIKKNDSIRRRARQAGHARSSASHTT